MDVFVKKMIEVKDTIMDKMKNNDIIMRADDWRDFATLLEDIEDVPTMIVIYNF